jgi:UDP-2,4-diacetamido-2,4,6-trideoxy-beta-L-altropyranose hydrolase
VQVFKKIILRADGSSSIGMGHVMRCIAVSQMLKNDFELAFALFKPETAIKALISEMGLAVIELPSQMETQYSKDCDAVLLDGYWFDTDYVKQIKEKGKKVIQIDDLAGREFFSDLVINHAMNADYSGSVFHHGGRLLSGISYAMLRPEFLDAAKRPGGYRELDSLLLNMGGADPKNYTLQLLECIQQLPQKFKSIAVIIGSAYAHKPALEAFIKNTPGLNVQVKESLGAGEIIALLEKTSLFICSASTIAYEAMAVKVPLACFITADNQKGIYAGLTGANALSGLGDISGYDRKDLTAVLAKAFSDFNLARSYMHNQEKLIDGRSGERIKEQVLSLWN